MRFARMEVGFVVASMLRTDCISSGGEGQINFPDSPTSQQWDPRGQRNLPRLHVSLDLCVFL